MAQPFDSAEEGEKVAAEFFNAVRKLREQYRIPELIIQFQLYVKTPEGIEAFAGGGGWGNQLYQARLAKRAIDQEFEHLGNVIESIAAAMPKARKELLTDPRFESPDEVKGDG